MVIAMKLPTVKSATKIIMMTMMMFTIIFAMGIVMTMMVMKMMMKYFASSDTNLHPLLDLRLLPLSSAAFIPTTNTIRIIIIDNNEVII